MREVDKRASISTAKEAIIQVVTHARGPFVGYAVAAGSDRELEAGGAADDSRHVRTLLQPGRPVEPVLCADWPLTSGAFDHGRRFPLTRRGTDEQVVMSGTIAMGDVQRRARPSASCSTASLDAHDTGHILFGDYVDRAHLCGVWEQLLGLKCRRHFLPLVRQS